MSPSSSLKRAQPVERDGRRQFNKLPLNVFSMSYGNDIKYLVEAVEVGEQKWIGQAPMDLQTSGTVKGFRDGNPWTIWQQRMRVKTRSRNEKQ